MAQPRWLREDAPEVFPELMPLPYRKPPSLNLVRSRQLWPFPVEMDRLDGLLAAQGKPAADGASSFVT